MQIDKYSLQATCTVDVLCSNDDVPTMPYRTDSHMVSPGRRLMTRSECTGTVVPPVATPAAILEDDERAGRTLASCDSKLRL